MGGNIGWPTLPLANPRSWQALWSQRSYYCVYFGFILERVLRRSDRLPNALRKRDLLWGWATVITGFLGGAALMLLSILDTIRYPTVHWTFTLLFIIFVGASAVCQTVEIYQLRSTHPDRAHLKRNCLFKAFIVSVAIAIAIAFGVLYITCDGRATSARCNLIISTAAVCEWTVSFILVLYFFTFILDFWPAAKTSPRHLNREGRKAARQLEKKLEDEVNEPNETTALDLDTSDNPHGADREDLRSSGDAERVYEAVPYNRFSDLTIIEDTVAQQGFIIDDGEYLPTKPPSG